MELIIKYFKSGKIDKSSKNSVISLSVNKISDINNIIIPFFDKHPILEIKQLDYLDFWKVAKLINEGSHTTIEGLDLIRSIKAGMNTGRYI
jgi:LAGLIDADG endonuclease